MAKTYIENIKLIAIRNKLFSGFVEKTHVDIFNVLSLSSGDFLPTQKMINGKYSVFGGGGITDKNHNEFNIQNETIGIGRVGARCGCVFKIPAESWVTDNALYANKIDSNFDIEFLIHYLNFKNLLQFANTSAQPVISLKRITSIKIPILTLNEQKEIVKILNDIENGIIKIEDDKYAIKGTFNFIYLKEDLDTELTHQLDLIKQLRQAFLREAMQGKLVKSTNAKETGQQLLAKIKAEKTQLIAEKKLKKEKELAPISEDEIPFEIPEHWAWCRLGELADIVRGGSPRPAGDLKYYQGTIPFLKVGDLTGYENKFCTNHNFTIKEAGLFKTRFVDENTLMLTNSGATLGIPRICTFPTTFNDGIAAFLNLNHIDKIFLYYFLKYKSDWFLKQASRGQGQPNLNTDIIGNTLFALPPINEQEQIVAKLEELMTFCDGLEQSIKESQGYNEMLLQQVLREALQPKEEVANG